MYQEGLQLYKNAKKKPLYCRWADMWEGPENPREYMNAVMENTICVAKWNELAIKNDLLESNQIIDLRKFFNPLTFLNALRQLTCRSGIYFYFLL